MLDVCIRLFFSSGLIFIYLIPLRWVIKEIRLFYTYIHTVFCLPGHSNLAHYLWRLRNIFTTKLIIPFSLCLIYSASINTSI